MGDVILTSATVLNLKRHYPKSHLVYLTKEQFVPLVESFDGVDEIVALPKGVGLTAYGRLLMGLDRQGFDIIVDLHGNPRSWLARKLIGANQQVVYPKRRLDRYLLTKKHKQMPEAWPHTIDLYNQAAIDVGAKAICRRPLMKVVANAAEDLPFSDPRDKRPIVFIAPGALHASKQWPMASFTEVARELAQKHEVRIIWAVVEADAGASGLESELAADSFAELVQWPLERLAPVMAASDLAITNDSGLAHMSSAVGTPVLAIFGPTHPVLGFAPRGLRDKVIETDEQCRPCSLHGSRPCFRERQYCFDRINPEDVVFAATSLLPQVGRDRALFVDRDGTVIVEKNYASDPDQIELESGAVEALRLAQQYGLKIVLLSNQSGVARGYFGLEDVGKMNNRLLQMLATKGVEVDGLYFCPHHPEGTVAGYGHACQCRKPAVGMAEEAALQLGLDLRRSFVVGDKLDDYWLGRAMGAKSVLVRTGHGREHEKLLAQAGISPAEAVRDDLLGAVRMIVEAM